MQVVPATGAELARQVGPRSSRDEIPAGPWNWTSAWEPSPTRVPLATLFPEAEDPPRFI